MVFDKQHLSLFVALAFLLVYANAVPTAINNDNNVERLRGDLHQFIEMIISCLTNTKMSNHSKVDPSQVKKFKQITNSLQEDVGLAVEETPENAEHHNENTRKFDVSSPHEHEEASSEVPQNEDESNSETNEESNNKSKESTESEVSKETSGQDISVENGNREVFDLQEGGGHNFTPRTSNMETTESESSERTAVMSTTTNANINTNQPQDDGDIGLRIFQSGSKEDTTDDTSQNEHISPETKTSSPSSENLSEGASSREDEKSAASNDAQESSNEEKLKSQLGKIQQNMSGGSKQYKPKYDGRKVYGEESTSSNSNESKDKLENNTEEIQVRNLIKETPQFVSGSSVDPYDALHIYGIRLNGPINKIVFEGGEQHPPRPLTVKESNLLKEFIRMIIKTNKMHSPMASFPYDDEVSSRSGFSDNTKKSPWADKPVPLEVV